MFKRLKNIGRSFSQWLRVLGGCALVWPGLLSANKVEGAMPAVIPFHREEIVGFLDAIAAAEAHEWERLSLDLPNRFPSLMPSGSVRDALNALREPILASDDLPLIRLYERAVRNHDGLSREQVDPVASYYRHYQPSSFSIPQIHLTFDVTEHCVQVTTALTVQREAEEESLILDGRGHRVSEVWVDERLLPKERYKVTSQELILLDIPREKHFQVRIKSTIDPFTNESLEGMYLCGQWLTTQCESEGARRIFFTLDRPDVLSRITTTIIADKVLYPYRLANGNQVSEQIEEDGRVSITWDDPYPKPSYLFACVLGRFSCLTDLFMTSSGRQVELQIYVEPGKESRAHYALFALKKAMEFDQVFFDREYDLNELKMVGIPQFNAGAMENKGLMIFNDIRLLVDEQSGTDKSYREVAMVVAHEYFHNWSGNRVTIRNWFEIALKEAFTDLRAMLFSEWLFGEGFVRPKAVRSLRELQFPEESSEGGHPLMVESYVDAHSIYDHTTYTKGREVFRALKNYLDMSVPEGFRKVQNLYFSRYDGQAVTFRELLSVADEVLQGVGKDISRFERWFHQPGTPIVSARLAYDETTHTAELIFSQSCPHPKTGQPQAPFQIPFSWELLSRDGSVLHPKTACLLEEEEHIFKVRVPERPVPVLMHGYSAPIILEYDYTLEELACIIEHTDDPFCRWEAAQNYSIQAFKEMRRRLESSPELEAMAQAGKTVFADLHQPYARALRSSLLSPLAKAQLLEIPSLRALAQAFDDYDFRRLEELRTLFMVQLARVCQPILTELLVFHPRPFPYEPSSAQMQVRELRQAVFGLLALVSADEREAIFRHYQTADHLDEAVSTFNLCLEMGSPYKEFVIADFYAKWKDDKAIFNFWLSSQASARDCKATDLCRLELAEGYDAKNPNHIRSIYRAFAANLHAYHEPMGEAYRCMVDKILEVAQFNPMVAHNHLAVPAFLDFERMPPKQKGLMAQELERLRSDRVPAQTRDWVEKLLRHNNPQPIVLKGTTSNPH